jgi:hypothetical protein
LEEKALSGRLAYVGKYIGYPLTRELILKKKGVR